MLKWQIPPKLSCSKQNPTKLHCTESIIRAQQEHRVPPQCPICREDITYFAKSAPEEIGCVCKQVRCNRHLVVMQKDDGLVRNVPDDLSVA